MPPSWPETRTCPRNSRIRPEIHTQFRTCWVRPEIHRQFRTCAYQNDHRPYVTVHFSFAFLLCLCLSGHHNASHLVLHYWKPSDFMLLSTLLDVRGQVICKAYITSTSISLEKNNWQSNAFWSLSPIEVWKTETSSMCCSISTQRAKVRELHLHVTGKLCL